MRGIGKFSRLRAGLSVAGCLMSCAPSVFAQASGGTKPEAPVAAAPAISGEDKTALKVRTHRFWDKENAWLFAGVGVSRTLDYLSTLNMRRRGRQEIFLTNEAVDNHVAFGVIEASAATASMGAAYLFHRCGHHKLERWTSFVHIGLATVGSVRNYCLKTAHPAVALGPP